MVFLPKQLPYEVVFSKSYINNSLPYFFLYSDSSDSLSTPLHPSLNSLSLFCLLRVGVLASNC